jgi:hypothetical protein
MRKTFELLLCGSIGTYCVWRCIAVMPGVMDELQVLFGAMLGRARDIEAAIEEAE